jgi:D-glucuronyl C5-epimerase C-terminus
VVSVRGLTGLFFAVVALLVASGAAGAPKPVPGERAALAAVAHAMKSGRLSRADASASRREIARAVHLVRVLPAGRRTHVEVALGQIGALGEKLTAPRAKALFGQLAANDHYFAQHGVPRAGTDIADADGIVYRYFSGKCFEFHPLANVSALNARVAAKDVDGAKRLAAALAARAVPRPGGGVAWEYYFRYGGGRPPWVSGMAQAVAAQAFARAAALVPDDSAALSDEATRAFRAVPRLTTAVAAGPWIRLYSFSRNPVLNAQLQSVVSLQSYATVTSDDAAATLASRMEQAAAATLRRFDTGYWTYYSLAGNPSPLSYHKFVIQLLHRLAPDDPRFAQAANRFATYLRQPPAFEVANASSAAALRFWLSKPARVTAATPAGRSVRLSLDAGWHTFRWHEPKRAGFYRVGVTAVDYAGNRASFSALPIVRVPRAGHGAKQGHGTAGAAPAGSPQFAVGSGVDDSRQAALASSLGIRLVRLSVAWQPGQTAPDPSVVSSLQALPAGVGLVLDLSAARLPADDAERAELARYATSLAGQTPVLHDLVLTPGPSRETARGYAKSLAAVRAAVRAVRTDVAVGLFLDGSSAKPQLTAVAVGRDLAEAGADADIVSFRPAPVPGPGALASGDLEVLESALAKGLGTAPPLLLDAPGTPTTVPSSESSAYTGGSPPAAGAVSPDVQAATYADAIEDASCSPDVAGVLLDRLVDSGSASEPATGVYYASGHAKPAAAAVKSAVRTVARGAVVCPGLVTPVTATTLTFPDELSSPSAASVALGCDRDCLYLVTLDRKNGNPVVARRGTLVGGAPATTVTLPTGALRRGGYRVDVRLVSRVGPGAVFRRRSPLRTPG